MAAQDDVPDLQLLARAVDTVLVPHGFAPGQVGADDRRGQVVWCSAAGAFAERFPRLPPSREPAGGWGTACTDVVVDVVHAEGAWRVTGVRLEGDSVDAVLDDLGSAGAAAAADLAGTPATGCLVLLPALLTRLLGEPTGAP